MSAFVGALLVLTATSQATVPACKTEHRRTVQCYGAVGKSVLLHLGISRKEIEIKTSRGGKRVLKYQYGRFNGHGNSTWNFSNGALMLNSALKSDSGEYSVEVHHRNGTLLLNSKIQLFIQAPLPKPVISQLCLPHGEVWVSCSSDGDATGYNWTLGGNPLGAGLAYWKDNKDTVILKKIMSSNITCFVANHFSHNFTTVQLSACLVPQFCTLPNGMKVAVSVKTTEDVQSPIIIKEILLSVGDNNNISAVCNSTSLTLDLGDRGKINRHADKGAVCVGIMGLSLAACAIFMLFVLMAAMLCLSRKKNRSGIPDDNNFQEVIYAEVTGLSREKVGRKKEKEQESTIVYGAIKATEAPDHLQGRAHGHVDVVYARLHKKTTLAE